MTARKWAWLALLGVLLGSCGGKTVNTVSPTENYVTLRELFVSEEAPADNLDSLAFWPPGPWVLATAKSIDQLVVLDANDGRVVHRFGERGDGPGQFRRPNGVAVVGDLVLVTERDNQRVQVLRLPELKPLGSLGAGLLRAPYGLAVFPGEDGVLELYVTDNYLTPDREIPPPHELGERVKHFRVFVSPEGVTAMLERSFGDTAGAGVLGTVESIAADRRWGRLLIADETRGTQDIKVYSLAGQFTGHVIGAGLFKGEPEGIALIEEGAGGFWIATDQRKERTAFHVFDRHSLRYLGSATGEQTANTDGIAIGVGAADGEARLFAVHDDRSVVAFSGASLLHALGLSNR